MLQGQILAMHSSVAVGLSLAATGFQFHWQSVPASGGGKAKKSSKTKFTCPGCGQNAWAKPDARLLCGACVDEEEGDIPFMLAEQ
jgi:ribosomal protein S27AE